MKLATQQRIADNLHILRINHGLSQAQMSSYVGLTRSLYAQYELGNRVPDAEALYDISMYFRITMNAFFEHNPENFISQVVFMEACSDGDTQLIKAFHNLSPYSKGRLMEKAELLLEWDRIKEENKSQLRSHLKDY